MNKKSSRSARVARSAEICHGAKTIFGSLGIGQLGNLGSMTKSKEGWPKRTLVFVKE